MELKINENTELTDIEPVVDEVFTDKQVKTTFGLRVTLQQKEFLLQHQKMFDNQGVFVDNILSFLDNAGNKQVYDDKNTLKIPITPFQAGLISFVAERESTDDVKVLPEHVLMYVFDEMLVKGNKFSIKSIPNGVIERYKDSLL